MNRRDSLISYLTLIRVVRWLLTGFIFLIPFQLFIFGILEKRNKVLATAITHFEEVMACVFSIIALIEVVKNRRALNQFHYVLLFPITMFCLFGFVSGMINGNSLLITTLGIFDYIKNFLFIFIYAVFFKEVSDLKRMYRILLVISLVLGFIAMIQEVWALGSVYILGKDKTDLSVYIFRSIWNEGVLESNYYWRFGIYRATSLMYGPNNFGLYLLLILTIYLCTKAKTKNMVIAPLFSGILLCVSRISYFGFLFVASVQFIRGKRWLLFFIIVPLIVSVFYMSSMKDMNFVELFSDMISDETDGKSNDTEPLPFRIYTRNKSVEIWKDYPIWGVGPGMFGGVISSLFDSPIYDEYDFKKIWVFERINSIDQFWPMVLAETGIIGIIFFITLFLTIIMTFFIYKSQLTSDETRGIFKAIAVFTIVILSYAFGNGLNIAPVLVTYCAFLGITLNCLNQDIMKYQTDVVD